MQDKHRSRKNQAHLSLPFQAAFANVSSTQGRYTLYAVVACTIIGITSHKPIIFLIQHLNPPAALFSVSLKFQGDLDKGTEIKELRWEFRKNGITLSHNASATIKKKDNTWVIADAQNKQKYIVRKAEKLDIYAGTPTQGAANLASTISFGICAVLLIASLLKMRSIISVIEGRRLAALNRRVNNRKKSDTSDG